MGQKATVSNNCNISLKEQQSLLMRQLEWSNCVKYQSCILQNSLLVVGPCKLELKYISRPTTLISQNSLLRDLYFNPGFSLQKIKRRKKKELKKYKGQNPKLPNRETYTFRSHLPKNPILGMTLPTTKLEQPSIIITSIVVHWWGWGLYSYTHIYKYTYTNIYIYIYILDCPCQWF